MRCGRYCHSQICLICLDALFAEQGFLAEGLQRTSAGLGSVIIDSQPLTVALLAALLFGEKLTAASYGGLALGVLGLSLLEVPVDVLATLPQKAVGRIQFHKRLQVSSYSKGWILREKSPCKAQLFAPSKNAY